ncbi:MAG: hypothetical protein AUG49_09210 [Catenulispora sp. 13_1_20CM_3_70_7]|nr:MAG: hypothetical protein AUG49_09210 [Catenulispora sp. 13_1_20CM_3_70_7]
MRVGPYRLLTELGSGAMGRVFLAADDAGRQVAVKMVRPELAGAPMFRKRFARELDVAQRVRGPHIAEIYAAHPDGPVPWLATEYVPGPTLQEAVDNGGCFTSPQVRALASAVADALMAIHLAGVVHRDLKPSNILLGPNGPKVIDFGVARAVDASLLTNTGQTLGTPAYMSPEQADGRAIESASDLFALGALLVYAAVGRLAFGEGAPLAILHRVVNNEPDLTGVAADDPELHRLIKQCLAKDPEDRPTAARLIDMLGAVPWQPLTGFAWRPPPLGVGLPRTVDAAAEPPTVTVAVAGAAARPKGRRGKRIAVLSAATAAVLAIAGIAIVEGIGQGRSSAKGSTLAGGSSPGLDPGSGAFPAGATASDNGAGSGANPNGGGPAASGGSAAAPGGSPVPAPGASTPTGTAQNPTGQPSGSRASHGGSTTPTTSKTSASKTTSKSASPSKSTTPPPAHKPPAPLASGEVKVNIPEWYLMAGIDVSWNAHPDATGYIVHFTKSDGDDETISVPDPWYSYQVEKGLTTCVQVKAVNEYGQTAFSPSPIYCVDPGPHQSH